MAGAVSSMVRVFGASTVVFARAGSRGLATGRFVTGLRFCAAFEPEVLVCGRAVGSGLRPRDWRPSTIPATNPIRTSPGAEKMPLWVIQNPSRCGFVELHRLNPGGESDNSMLCLADWFKLNSLQP